MSKTLKKFTIKGATTRIKDGVGMYFGINENQGQNASDENSEPYWMQDSFWEKSTPMQRNSTLKRDMEMQPYPDSPPAYSPPRKSQPPLQGQPQVIQYNPNGEGSTSTQIDGTTTTTTPTTMDYYPPNVILSDQSSTGTSMTQDDDERGRGRGKGRGRGRGRGAQNNNNAGSYHQMTDASQTDDGGGIPMQNLGKTTEKVPSRGRVSTLGRGVSSLSLKDEHKMGPPPEQHYPYFILLISFIDVVLLVWEIIYNKGFEPWKLNPWFGPGVSTLLDVGAKYSPLMLQGEWWRFFSPIFLHVGIFHLLMNLVTQIRVGMQLERAYGAHRIIPIYLLCGVMGNLCSAVMLPLSIQVGASGAIFGFLGVLLADLVRNWGSLARPYLNCCSLVFTIIISFAVGLFLPGVDNYAHLGGFVMGILTGWIFLPNLTPKKAVGRRLCLILIAIPLTVAIFVTLFVVFYKRIDSAEWCPNCSNFTCLKFLSWCKQ
ncbi:beta-lactamase family protein [Tieghemostelium lacteum]|uniref:rhomboid protease n=1 Tax=Tieghemostelium lacteum TaxID=361077 RepID=A0A152A6L5_TIELA|nr:beta-lactamase family protein [Tieghemostelium lacteum]|eukprot:KYR01878.1 beta-lactamase family protein [Tieghemostelium lacteum]